LTNTYNASAFVRDRRLFISRQYLLLYNIYYIFIIRDIVYNTFVIDNNNYRKMLRV